MAATLDFYIERYYRFFDPEPKTRKIAMELYNSVKDLQIVSFHSHVPAEILANNEPFSNPTELILIPDHYIFRVLHASGVSYEDIGVTGQKGEKRPDFDPRKAWKIFAENYYLFAGTPMANWLEVQLAQLFGVEEKLDAGTADKTYDQIQERLQSPEYRPRELYHQFNLEVLCTTDNPWDSLDAHAEMRAHPEWGINVIPGWRPDGITNLTDPQWLENIRKLGEAEGIDIKNHDDLRKARKSSRQRFKELGAALTDHGVAQPYTGYMGGADKLFWWVTKNLPASSLLRKRFAKAYSGHSLMLSAEESVEDGLTMQIHTGVYRNHNDAVMARYGRDMGFDIPAEVEFVRNLHPVLNEFGMDPRLRLVVYSMDSDAYKRELVPLAGAYSALYLGANWWIEDEAEQLCDTLRITMKRDVPAYKIAGFPDDTRGYLSIPVRHDTARRAYANGLARMVAREELSKSDAFRIIRWLSYDGPREVFNLNKDYRDAA